MQITDRTAYGLLILRALSGGATVTNDELAERLGCSRPYMVKILRAMVAAQLVRGTRGRGATSGYALAHNKVRGLSVAEIIARLDGGVVAPTKGQSGDMAMVRRVLQRRISESLGSLTVGELLGG